MTNPLTTKRETINANIIGGQEVNPEMIYSGIAGHGAYKSKKLILFLILIVLVKNKQSKQ